MNARFVSLMYCPRFQTTLTFPGYSETEPWKVSVQKVDLPQTSKLVLEVNGRYVTYDIDDMIKNIAKNKVHSKKFYNKLKEKLRYEKFVVDPISGKIDNLTEILMRNL